eukprot:6186871-Pleurochrysis_carterae.AAC.1
MTRTRTTFITTPCSSSLTGSLPATTRAASPTMTVNRQASPSLHRNLQSAFNITTRLIKLFT